MKCFYLMILFVLFGIPTGYFSPLMAKEISGVEFDDAFKGGDLTMPLIGTGLKTVLFFKAFVAAYYSDLNGAADEIGQFPKRIEVQYFVNIPGVKLNNYTRDRMKLNATDEEMKSVQTQFAEMATYFVDLKIGDRFALTYLPNEGTRFEHNGKLMGVVRGSVFAKVLFAVWIGDKPFDVVLKKQILGDGQIPVESAQIQDLPESDITPGYSSMILSFGPEQTTMEASIKYAVMGKYVAQFKAFKGSVAIDEASKEIQSVFVEIDASSIFSSCTWCDDVARSSKGLNASKYKTIVLKSNEISKDAGGYVLKGSLEMHGHVKEVAFPFQLELIKDDRSDQPFLQMNGTWAINRKDYGVVWSQLLDRGGIILGDVLNVRWKIKLQAR